MHITNTQIQKVLELHLHRVSRARPCAAPDPTARPDELLLSSRAEELQQVKRKAASLPEVRVGLVADMKRSVQSGEYRVSALEVAQKMLSSAREAERGRRS